jgi:hypothetical protein
MVMSYLASDKISLFSNQSISSHIRVLRGQSATGADTGGPAGGHTPDGPSHHRLEAVNNRIQRFDRGH